MQTKEKSWCRCLSLLELGDPRASPRATAAASRSSREAASRDELRGDDVIESSPTRVANQCPDSQGPVPASQSPTLLTAPPNRQCGRPSVGAGGPAKQQAARDDAQIDTFAKPPADMGTRRASCVSSHALSFELAQGFVLVRRLRTLATQCAHCEVPGSVGR